MRQIYYEIHTNYSAEVGLMTSVTPAGGDATSRRRVIAEIKQSVRALSLQLALLNRQVGAHADLKDTDFSCLELINRFGPISPSALARRTGLHPATVTGVLDRLERAGWIVRERDPQAADRRAVTVRALRDRNHELYQLYSGMNTAMDDIFAGYDDAQLDTLADFLRRTTDAGHEATEKLAGS
jgi:DNA-binding MarR family transcriptional regulator